MSHLSDKELDRLSREAAEQNDVPQNTSGWDSLHLRLDKELPVNPRRQRRNLLLLLSLLVLLTGSGLTYQYVNGPAPAANQVSDEITIMNDQEGTRKKISGSEKNSEGLTPRSESPEHDVAGSSGTKSTQQNNDTEIAAQKKSIPGSTRIPTEKTNSQSQVVTKKNPVSDLNKNSLNPNNNSSRKNQTRSSIVASGNQQSVDKNVLQPLPGKKMNADVVNHPQPSMGMEPDLSLFEISKPAILRNTGNANDISSSLPFIAGKNKAQQSTGRKFPFSLSVVGGADWTTVKFTHKENAGYNAGLTFTWHFATKFSVTTGALYTKKNYSALGKDYHPPKGYWTNYITLDEVNGSCWMIDIPLNIRYDFAGGKKSNFFGSAGASTYLMDKESYTYHYMYNGNYTSRKWDNDNNSSHLFSILNLSAGYEKEVSKNVSAQIEPYLKMPMSGIGFGNMQMSSYGLNFSIRYRPAFKKQNTTVPVKHP